MTKWFYTRIFLRIFWVGHYCQIKITMQLNKKVCPRVWDTMGVSSRPSNPSRQIGANLLFLLWTLFSLALFTGAQYIIRLNFFSSTFVEQVTDHSRLPVIRNRLRSVDGIVEWNTGVLWKPQCTYTDTHSHTYLATTQKRIVFRFHYKY